MLLPRRKLPLEGVCHFDSRSCQTLGVPRQSRGFTLGNYVMISLEDSVPNFVHRLFTKYFAREPVYRRDQSPQDIAWLGKLALFIRRYLRNSETLSIV